MNGTRAKKKSESVQNVIVAGGISPEKKCKGCGQFLPIDSFHKSNKGKYGRQNKCKKCCTEYGEKNRAKLTVQSRIRRNKNKDHVNEKKRGYYHANPEKINQQNNQWKLAHPEKARGYSANFRNDNPEKVKEIYKKFYYSHQEEENDRCKLYRENNQEKVIFLRRRHYRENTEYYIEKAHGRRALELNTQTEKINVQEIFERDNWICQICSFPVDKDLKNRDSLRKSLDHILPLSKGGTHTKDNLQLAHYTCNLRANDKIKTPKVIQKIRDEIIKLMSKRKLLED